MYIPRYPTLWPKSFLAGKNTQMPFPLDQEACYFYRNGTDAIMHAIQLLHLSPGSRVLVPSYTCINTVEPFRRSGIEVVYYKVNRDLSFDKEDIETKLENGVSALLFIHYFGFPQDLQYLTALKHRTGIYLIEDCAHAFLSDADGRSMGITGDVSIFSLRKIIPLNNSGLLMVNNMSISVSGNYGGTNVSAAFIKGSVKRLLENMKLRSGMNFRVKQSQDRDTVFDSAIYARKLDIRSHGISAPLLHTMLLHKLNYEYIKKRRRANYLTLLTGISCSAEVDILVKELPDGVNCLAFPIVTPRRDSVCSRLNKAGIDAFPWPNLPPDAERADCTAAYLSKTILLLPVHQDLNEKHLGRIISIVNEQGIV